MKDKRIMTLQRRNLENVIKKINNELFKQPYHHLRN